MGDGWISIHRKIQESWLWDEKPFSRAQAWIDLLLLTNYTDKKTLIKNELRLVKRGSFVTSLRKLSKKWGWSTVKLKNFMNLLQAEKMIDFWSDCKITTIKVLNYDYYQHQNSLSLTTPISTEGLPNAEKTQKNTEKDSIEPQQIPGFFDKKDSPSSYISITSRKSKNAGKTQENLCPNTEKMQKELTNKDNNVNNSNKDNNIINNIPDSKYSELIKIQNYYIEKSNSKDLDISQISSLSTLIENDIPLDIIKQGIDLYLKDINHKSSFQSCILAIYKLYKSLLEEENTDNVPRTQPCSDMRKVVEAYCNTFHKMDTDISTNELNVAISISDTYPLSVIKNGIMDAYNTTKSRGINVWSLKYCVPFIKKQYETFKNHKNIFITKNNNLGKVDELGGDYTKFNEEWLKSHGLLEEL